MEINKNKFEELERIVYYLYRKSCWNLLGNSDTISGNTGSTYCGTNFIGTTNSQNLEVRLNSSRTNFFRFTKEGTIEFINPASNTFIGLLAGYGNSGTQNVAIGNNCLSNSSSGNSNSCLGVSCLSLNETGNENCGFGHSSLLFNRSGSRNTSMGYFSLRSNQNSDSTAIGANSLQSNFSGNQNTSVGSQSLKNDCIGSNNTAIGFESLSNNGTNNTDNASGNTAVGSQSLKSNYTGNNLTCIGYQADLNTDGYSNSSALGYSAKITASNQIILGNSDITEIGGYANWSNVSDLRLKKDIKEDVQGLNFITKLRPVTYTMNNIVKTGLIAQEVEQICKEIGYDFDGVIIPENENNYYKLCYSTFVPCLIESIKELKNEINQLKIEIIKGNDIKI